MGDETICAIATPIGEGGVGIVRISGADAVAVAEQVVRLRSGRPVASVPSHTLQLADMLLPPSGGASSTPAVLDEGLVVVMAAPQSFTGETVVELHCHGSRLILARVCEACMRAGARMAQPGEFTKRAFLNGRLDLSQAEAVLDTIRAKSDAALRVAQRHLRGDLGRQIEGLRGRLVGQLAQVEAGIDFSEEDIAFVGRDELLKTVRQTTESIDAMLATTRRGRLLREGARVVIIGPPNVGKSSLLNRILQEDRAIVTDIPGTTRDVIEESTILEGMVLSLVDTAGLRKTDDPVEREGIRRTRVAQEEADLVVQVISAVAPEDSAAVGSVAVGEAQARLVALNKIDALDEADVAVLRASLEREMGAEVIPISARTGAGLPELKARIAALLGGGLLEARDGVVVTNVRHQAALEQAAASLRAASRAIEEGAEAEFVAVDLREAADALGEITGAITTADVLERIFSEFCIGK